MPGVTVDLGEMQRMAIMAAESGTQLPAAMQNFVAHAISDAMSHIFLSSLVIVAVAFIAILFIPTITLRGRGPGAVEAAAELSPAVAPTGARGAEAVGRGNTG